MRLIHSDGKLKKVNETLHFLLRERLYVGKENYMVVESLLVTVALCFRIILAQFSDVWI